MTQARTEVVTIRVTKEQKKRIQRIARKKGESVSTLLLRAVESAEALPPRQTKESGKTIRIVIGTPTQDTSRPEVKGDGTAFELSDEAHKLAE